MDKLIQFILFAIQERANNAKRSEENHPCLQDRAESKIRRLAYEVAKSDIEKAIEFYKTNPATFEFVPKDADWSLEPGEEKI